MILRPGWEWRFDVGFAAPGVTVKVESGTCERDGIELAPRHGYTLRGVRSRLLTWQGCELEIEGRCEEETAGPATAGAAAGNGVPGVADGLVNLHASLDEMRRASSRSGAEGPRVAVVGPRGSGKTSAVRTLASYAVRRSHQPLVANLDPGEGMLTLPGTLSAAVLATVMDPEAPDAWGSTPTSGPSATPVKLPIVHYLGRKDAEGDREAYRELVARLAGSVSHRLSAADDAVVKASGLLVDCPAGLEGELLAHIVDEMSGTHAWERWDVVWNMVLTVACSQHYTGDWTARRRGRPGQTLRWRKD